MLFINKSQEKEINRLKWQVSQLHRKVSFLESKITHDQQLTQAQLLRIKNGECLSDDYILNSSSYMDLSPEKAFELYNDLDRDFVLLDVSQSCYKPAKQLPEAIYIPLEDLPESGHKLFGAAKNYLVISEDGVRSIIACKILNEFGFYNLSNISGGYKFWPGFGKQALYSKESSAA